MLDQSTPINTVVFIDTQLPNYQTLIAGLPDNSIYFVLDAQKDGIEQIEQFLASYSNLDSIQILSHGSQGSLYLGNAVLSNNSLKKYQVQLFNIGSHLKDTGDILLYGCNVAQGDTGLQFIDALAKATGADVAASDDLTGSSNLGGDWLLEAQTGSIEAATLNPQIYNAILVTNAGSVINGTSGNDTLNGNGLNDTITGLDGDDSIDGQAGSDSLDGGTGNDTLNGNFGNDTLLGGAGDDALIDDQGANYLDGGDGNDNLQAHSLSGNQTLIGGLGADTLNAVGLAVYLDGGEEADNLTASGMLDINNTSSYVQHGTATLVGGLGDDYLTASYEATASLQGGDGNDSLSVSRSKNATVEGGAGNDSLTAFFYGWPNAQIGESYGVNYRLDGGTGDDVLTATGYGYSFYGAVSLSLEGGDGNDVLTVYDYLAANGSEIAHASLSGGAGNDTLTASNVLDLTLTGGTGQDTFVLTAQQFQTLQLGTMQFATQQGTQANNWDSAYTSVTAAPITITDFVAGNGGDILSLTDLLKNGATGYDGSNPFATGHLALVQSGSDTLLQFDADGFGTASNMITMAVLQNVDSTLITAANFSPSFGTPNNDYLDGTPGADKLYGLAGADTLIGGLGNDTLSRGTGNDLLYAGSGNDVVDAGAGNDLIIGGDGAGDDTYVGGDGFDTIKYTSAVADITVDLLNGTAFATAGADAAHIGVDSLSSIEGIIAGNYNDTLIGNDVDNDINGEAGNDTITGGGGNDTIEGGDGSDTAVFSGTYANYTKSFNSVTNQYTLIANSGSEGTDIVSNVEFFKFSDKIVAASNLINTAPTLTVFNSNVATANEDSQIAITFANLQTQGNEADVDGTVDAFVIKAVSTGTLLIGTSAGTATAWNVSTNNTVDATHLAYWTPDANANGILNAFTAVAKDNGGAESVTPVQATVSVVNVNDAPTGTVTISGTPTQGQILTASNTLADADGLGTITYSWYASGSAVSIGTGSTFTLTQAQVGKTITVVASYTDLLGTAESVSSPVTTAVVNVNDAPTGTVTISGTPTQGQILTASNTLADADGLGTITYSWYASGSAVSIGTGSTFTLTQAQVGKTITVVASYTDLLGTAESVSSSVTTAIVGLIVTPQTFVSTIANETFTAVTTNDTVSYVNATAGVALSLLSTVAQNNVAAGMGSDTLVGIANLIGGGFNDTLTGNANNNVLSGGAGVDSLLGGLGANTLTGGTGIDTFTVTGTDAISDLGAGGADVLKVSVGAIANATVTAAWTATATTTNSGTANLTTNGFAVNLALVTTGTNGFNVTNTGVATTLTGSGLADTLIGGTGNDVLVGGAGNDILSASLGTNTLTGGTGIDTFTVTGTDTISDLGSGGADILNVALGALANTTVTAAWTATVSTVNNGTANLTTNGLAVNLALVTTGTNGYKVTNTGVATTLTGSALADTLIGGTGADSLLGGLGTNTLTGGTGIDTFTVTGTDTISDLGNGGADVLKVSAGATVNATVTAAWTATAITTNNGTANLTTNGLAVNLALVTTGTNGYKVTNTGAATTLTGSALADTLIGGTGADSLIGGLGNDSLTGGTGLDTFTVASGTDTITDLGNGGADVLKVSAGATVNATVTAAWTATATTTNSGTANLTTNGFAVNLALVTTGTNGYKVTNTGLATTLTGSALADTLIGGTGADIVSGGKGQDNLTGGLGLDTFTFAAGDDGITATTLDKILDYAKGAVSTGDLIDYSANLTIGGNANVATATQASINVTTGIATFASGSGTTLADALNDIAARFTAATNTVGEFAFFKVNNTGDYYLFISDGTAGAAANDDVIQLVGVTSISGINLTSGNLTITG